MNNALQMNALENAAPPAERETRRGLTLSVELVAYALLLLIAAALRLAELDTVPLLPAEAREALAAYRAAVPAAVGAPIVSNSPLIFALQVTSFSVLGAEEFTARLLTALGGVGLVFAPLLFRAHFGAARTFVICLMLALSPIVLIASRYSAPVIWTALFALLFIWALWRYAGNRRTAHAVAAASFAAALLFLTEAGGPLVLLVVIAALMIARRASADIELDVFEDGEEAPSARRGWIELARAFPWKIALPTAGLLAASVATLLLIYPAGLTAAGEVIAGAVRGFWQPYPARTPLFPLVVSLFYDTFLWVLALAGLWIAYRRGELAFTEWFAVALLVLFAVLSVVYVGAAPWHGVWFSLPLIILVSGLVERMLRSGERSIYWPVPYYARWIVAAVVIGLLTALAVAFHSVARSLLDAPDGNPALAIFDPASVVLLAVSALFLLVTFFMVASVWHQRTAWRGFGLGVVIFAVYTSLGAGWNSAVRESERPSDLIHMTATSRDVFLFRETMLELAQRQTRGFPALPVVVRAPQDGVVAWMLRDFTSVRYVSDFEQARGEGVFVNALGGRPNDLGGPYVGQDFTLYTRWDINSLKPLDVFSWWAQRFVRQRTSAFENVDLWARQDIYTGLQEGEIAG